MAVVWMVAVIQGRVPATAAPGEAAAVAAAVTAVMVETVAMVVQGAAAPQEATINLLGEVVEGACHLAALQGVGQTPGMGLTGCQLAV
jgi:hypothetical protein